jgi:hypothetical protein
MFPSQTHSLFVRDRTRSNDAAGTSTDHLRGELQFLGETREYRTAIEKELEVWADVLTETDSIDRYTLKRAVSVICSFEKSSEKADLPRCSPEPLLNPV